MTRRVFVVGLIVECTDDVEPPDRHDMACWLDGLTAPGIDRITRVVDCTVWDTLSDLVTDLTTAPAVIRDDRVLAALRTCGASRSWWAQRQGPFGPQLGGKSEVRP